MAEPNHGPVTTSRMLQCTSDRVDGIKPATAAASSTQGTEYQATFSG